MSKFRLLGAVCAALLSFVSVSANAALIGVLPSTRGGTDYQAYYDDQLDITWTANANISGRGPWWGQKLWAAGLDIDGVTGWRLPSLNEYDHLFHYGAGMVYGEGVTYFNPSPFSNVQPAEYWSGTKWTAPDWFPDRFPPDVYTFDFRFGRGYPEYSHRPMHAWAVHSGNVGAVPLPPALLLFGSALIGLVGLKRKRA